MFMLIGDYTTDSDKSCLLYKVARQFYVPGDVFRALGHRHTTGCVKLQLTSFTEEYVPSKSRQVGDVSLDLVEILKVFCGIYVWYKVLWTWENQDSTPMDRGYVKNTLGICC